MVTPAYARAWATRKLIAPVDDLFKREKLDGKDFPVSLWKPMGHGGKVDFETALGALREAGGGQIADGWWTLDLHDEADATAVARESKAFMDSLARRVTG